MASERAPGARRDPTRLALVILGALALAVYALVAGSLDAWEAVHRGTRHAEAADLDEFLLLPALLVAPLFLYALRQRRAADVERTARRVAEGERARLATLPEQAGAAMVEYTTEGRVTFQNAAAKQLLPDLSSRGLAHPFLAQAARAVADADPGGRIPTTHEVRVGERAYQQTLWRVPENGLIRVMLHDVTPQRAAEEALRRREAQLAEAEALAHLGSWEWHIAADRVFWSEELRRIFAMPAVESPGTIQDLLAHIHPDDRAKASAALDGAVRSRTPFRGDLRIVRGDGSIGVVHTVGKVMLDGRSRVTRLLGTARDVTEGREADRRAAQEHAFVALLKSVAVSANDAGSPEAAFTSTLRLVCSFMRWPLGHAQLVVAGNRLEPTKWWHLAEPTRHARFVAVTEAWPLAAGQGLPGRVLASGAAAWTTEATFDPRSPRTAVLHDLGLRAGFAFPVLVGKEVVAVLEFFGADAAEPDGALLDVMAQIGTQLGRVVERARAADERAIHEGLVRARGEEGKR